MPRKRKSYPELEALRHLLGNLPDHEVAARAGTSASIVGRYRRSLKIGAYDGYKFGNDSRAPDASRPASVGAADAPSKRAKTPAKKASGGGKSTGRRSKITPFHDQVGTIPDKEVAGLAGVTTEAVRMYRRRRGIDLQVEKTAGPKKKRRASRRRSRLDPFFDELGQVPDAEIAAKAGVTPENVRAFRARHGIKAEYRRTRRSAKQVAATARSESAVVSVEAAVSPSVAVHAEAGVSSGGARTPEGSEAAARVVESAAQAYAIQIVGIDETWVLFAEDVAKAAVCAMRSLDAFAPGGRIGSITHLGRALV